MGVNNTPGFKPVTSEVGSQNFKHYTTKTPSQVFFNPVTHRFTGLLPALLENTLINNFFMYKMQNHINTALYITITYSYTLQEFKKLASEMPRPHSLCEHQ